VVCPECGGTNIGWGGMAARRGKRRQRLKCLNKDCKHTFYPEGEKREPKQPKA